MGMLTCPAPSTEELNNAVNQNARIFKSIQKIWGKKVENNFSDAVARSTD